MAFIKLDGYLKKFLSFSPKKDQSPEIHDFIRKIFPKGEFKLKVKGRTIFLYDLSFADKNEIFLKREEILAGLKNKFGENAPISINFQKF